MDIAVPSLVKYIYSGHSLPNAAMLQGGMQEQRTGSLTRFVLFESVPHTDKRYKVRIKRILSHVSLGEKTCY